MTAPRTDSHRPAALVTENYDLYAFLDFSPPPPQVVGPNANGQYFTIPDPLAPQRRKLLAELAMSDEHRMHGQCDHCGARIRYTAILRYLPTGGLISVGEQCLDNRFSRATGEFQAMRKAAELDRQQQRIKKAVAAFVELHPDLAWMASQEQTWVNAGLTAEGGEIRGRRPNHFLIDVAHRLRKNGELSDKQVAAVRTSLARDAQFAAERAVKAAARAEIEAAAPPPQEVPIGRQVVTGEVISARTQDGRFGTEYKWLVKDDRGFKVWSSIPADVRVYTDARTRGERYRSTDSLKGARVSFTVEVEQSKDDPFFGFGRRPTKGAVLAEAPAVGK